MPKTVKKCYGQQDRFMLPFCGSCRYIKGCYKKSFEELDTIEATGESKEQLKQIEKMFGD